MKIIDDKTPSYAKPSMFLHGLTGCGKSTWSITGGKPLVILTEPKAASVLRLINSNAVGLAPESLDDLIKVFEFLGQTDKLQARGFDRIVLDSVTELTNSVPRWMRDQAGNRNVLIRLAIDEYGDVSDWAGAMVKAIQLTGFPSVIIARSVSKKVGLIEKIVPDGTGSSVNKLPGKLLPTAEARFDDELGWVIDTTPASHSQRCGLPWVSPIWTGSCQDFLALVERGPAEGPQVSVPPPPPAPPPELPAAWVTAIVDLNELMHRVAPDKQEETVKLWEAKGPGVLNDLVKILAGLRKRLPKETSMETAPETAQEAFSAQQDLKQEAKAPVSQLAEDFVEEVSPSGITDHEWRELLDLCMEQKVNQDHLYAYCEGRDKLLPGNPDKKLGLLKKAEWKALLGLIRNPVKRRCLVAAITPIPTTSSAA